MRWSVIEAGITTQWDKSREKNGCLEVSEGGISGRQRERFYTERRRVYAISEGETALYEEGRLNGVDCILQFQTQTTCKIDENKWTAEIN